MVDGVGDGMGGGIVDGVVDEMGDECRWVLMGVDGTAGP